MASKLWLLKTAGSGVLVGVCIWAVWSTGYEAGVNATKLKQAQSNIKEMRREAETNDAISSEIRDFAIGDSPSEWMRERGWYTPPEASPDSSVQQSENCYCTRTGE